MVSIVGENGHGAVRDQKKKGGEGRYSTWMLDQ
jgi:hypothetical protein